MKFSSNRHAHAWACWHSNGTDIGGEPVPDGRTAQVMLPAAGELAAGIVSSPPNHGATSDMSGGNGDDHLVGGTHDDELFGSGGNDKLEGGDGNDQLAGGSGVDILIGGNGNDVLYSGTSSQHDGLSADHLAGGAGDDELQIGTGGSADGGAGWDTIAVDLSGSAGGVSLDLANLADGGSLNLAGGTISGVEAWGAIIGSSHADILSLGGLAEGSWGGAPFEAPFVDGEAGNDQIDAHSANSDGVYIDGGTGDDTIIGSNSADTLLGSDGNDHLDAGSGNDNVDGGAGADWIAGGDGDDYLTGGAGSRLHGNDGDDTIITAGWSAGEAGTHVYGNAGDDSIQATWGDYVDGGSGRDVLTLSPNGDRAINANFATGTFATGGGVSQVDVFTQLQLGGGDDVVVLGSQQIAGEQGYQDGLFGGGGDDKLTAGTKAVPLFGESGSDELNGAAANDMLDGGTGDDRLNGGAGTDTLIGDSGHNRLDGGDGSDIVSYQAAVSGVHIDLGQAGEQKTGLGKDTLVSVEGVIGSDYNDVLSGSMGANNFYVSAGSDKIDGRDGNDTLHLNLPGFDPWYYPVTIDLGTSSAQTINGIGTVALTSVEDVDAAGDQVTIKGNSAANQLTGADAADVLTGMDGDDTLMGNGGTDQLDGGSGKDRIDGGSGADVVTGGNGPDTLVGGSGDDKLTGGADGDTISGGSGNDLILIDKATDLLGDSLSGGSGSDRLELSAAHPDQANLAASLAANDIEQLEAAGWTLSLSATEFDGLTFVDAAAIQLTTKGAVDLAHTTLSLTRLGLSDTGNSVSLRNASGSDQLHVTGGAGADTVIAGAAAIVASGGAGDDVLTGGSGNDTLSGGLGKDGVSGGDGNDTITYASVAEMSGDTISGGKGQDTLRLLPDHPGAVDPSLLLATRDIEAIDAAGWSLTLSDTAASSLSTIVADSLHLRDGGTLALHASLTVSDIYVSDKATTLDLHQVTEGKQLVIHGGAQADHLIGSAHAETFHGGAGNDNLDGGGGYDTFYVDAGDTVSASSSGQVIASIDYSLGAHLSDLQLTGGARTGTGNDLANVITGTGGDDKLLGGAGNDTLHGGDGNDVLHGGIGNDALSGGAGDDMLFLQNAPGGLDGGAGHDILYSSVNVANWITGIEEVHLQDGATSIALTGLASAETIYGNANAGSMLTGGVASDVIVGGTGNDSITGGAGDDHLTGGRGADTFAFDHLSSTETDRITDYNANDGDVLDFSGIEGQVEAAGVSEIDYLGTGTFTGEKGEAHILLFAGYGLFQFDLDGDRVSDLTIRLDGVTAQSTIEYNL